MPPACVAAALRIRRLIIFRVAGVPDIETSLAREELPVARIAGRKNTVEHVDAASDRLHKVLRRAGTHQISWLRDRQPPGGLCDDLVHQVDRFSDTQAADGVTLETDCLSRFRTLAAKVREHAALDDPELRLPCVADRHVRGRRGPQRLE